MLARRRSSYGFCILVLLLVTGCNPTPVVIERIVEVTATPAPTDTAEPTQVPTATFTPKPTRTPRPTHTPRPTRTHTPVPSPTPIPQPVLYEGTGDSVVDVDYSFSPALIHVIGNASGHHFAVTSYDANGNRLELYVNTTDPYDGVRLLDIRDNEKTSRFEVKATGSWKIEILPFALNNLIWLQMPDTVSAHSDNVVFLSGGSPDLLKVSAPNRKHIAIYAWTDTRRDLRVNDVGPYEGTVVLPSDTNLLEIQTDGDWTIDVSAR